MARNVASCTGRNLRLITEEFSLNPWLATVSQIRQQFLLCDIPPEQEWVLPELAAALEERLEREGEGEEGEEMDFLTFVIDSYASI